MKGMTMKSRLPYAQSVKSCITIYRYEFGTYFVLSPLLLTGCLSFHGPYEIFFTNTEAYLHGPWATSSNLTP